MRLSTAVKKDHQVKSSDIVAYVHDCLRPQHLQSSEKTYRVSEQIVHQIDEFYHRHRLWRYCRGVMEHKKNIGIDKSYLEAREELLQKMTIFKKTHREELEAHARQMSHIEKVISKCEERKLHFGNELQRYREHPSEKSDESIQRLESRLQEFEEEIQFRQHVLKVQKELAANKFMSLTEMEQSLCSLKKDFQVLLNKAIKEAQLLDIPESTALTLAHYIINDGYFTYIPEEEWEQIISNINAKEQTALKNHFYYDRKKLAYLLNDEQCYISPIQRAYLLGDSKSSGISHLDYQVKRILSGQLEHLSFNTYLSDVKSFYAFLVNEALTDGILTIDEMKMLDQIAFQLGLNVKAAREIINREALSLQKKVINEQMMVFYDLAMADGVMQRDEAKFLMEMNVKLEKQIINKISDVMQSRQTYLRLFLDSEELFVDMCKMVMQDGILASQECEILMDYTQKQGWDRCKIQPILLKAVNKDN